MRDDSPAAPEKSGADDQVRELCHDLADAEDHPRVGLCFLLPLLEDVAIGDELGLRLDHDSRSDENKVEQRKHASLQIGVRVAYFPVTD